MNVHDNSNPISPPAIDAAWIEVECDSQRQRIQLLTQRSAGRDGRVLRARSESHSNLDIWQLTSSDDTRFGGLTLPQRFRLAGLCIEHDRLVCQGELPHGSPVIVTKSTARLSLDAWLMKHDAPSGEQLPNVFAQLAASLLAAHQFGLTHGQLDQASIIIQDDRWAIDFLTSFDFGFAKPEEHCVTESNERYTTEGDLLCLATILIRLATGKLPTNQESVAELLSNTKNLSDDTKQLMASMLDPIPANRPTLNEFVSHFAVSNERAETFEVDETLIVDGSQSESVPDFSIRSEAHPARLGRFELQERIGEGGQGSVYRAIDLSDQSTVAVKIAKGVDRSGDDLLRFKREICLLAEIQSPFVTRFHAADTVGEHTYLAMEFVEGESLARRVAREGSLAIEEALRIAADVARGLRQVHLRECVHRDVKPDNILLVRREIVATDESAVAKLADFGLSRGIAGGDQPSITRTGQIVGTPAYMAPEQCAESRSECAATDIYALGATLFFMLAGRPPFEADSPLDLLSQQRFDIPPSVTEYRPDVPEAVANFVANTLEKNAENRPANADAFLHQVTRLIRGESTGEVSPSPTRKRSGLIEYRFEWSFSATPADVWPLVSNTNRLNASAGLPALDFFHESDGDGRARTFGSITFAGQRVLWEEHPFEWVEGSWFSNLREFSQGPFLRIFNRVELTSEGSGTRLTQTIEVEPRGLVGRMIAATEIGIRVRRGFERVYRKLDKTLRGSKNKQYASAKPASNESRSQIRLGVERAIEAGGDKAVLQNVADYLTHATPQQISRIRPLVFARSFESEEETAVESLIVAARSGLLTTLWDVICPVCRVASESHANLNEVGSHANCEVCQLEYEANVGKNVELSFSVHPRIRKPDRAVYCSGGPAHSPHIHAQRTIGPNESCSLNLALSEGDYSIKSRQLPYDLELRVRPWGREGEHEVELSPTGRQRQYIVPCGQQQIVICNDHDTELVVRIERKAMSHDVLTAAQVRLNPRYRQRFGADFFPTNRPIAISDLSVVCVMWQTEQDSDDQRMLETFHRIYSTVDDLIERREGRVLEASQHQVTLAFNDPRHAVEFASLLATRIESDCENPTRVMWRMGIHRGSVVATRLDSELVYVGRTLANLAELIQQTPNRALSVSDKVIEDCDALRELSHWTARPMRTLVLTDQSELAVHCFEPFPIG